MNAKVPSEHVELVRPRPVFSWTRAISAVIVVIIAALIVAGMITNPNYRWDKVAEYLFHPSIVRGIFYTIGLTVGAMIIGVILAITMAIMRQSTNPIMKSVSWFYIWFFRGTPVYTQLIFWGLLPTLYERITLGIPFGPEFFSVKTADVITAGWAALLGLGLNEGAYLAEIVRSGFNAVDAGQSEAATALGMRRSQIMRRIILPQAMRVIVPPTGNETISMLKTTALVSAVPFTLELQFAAQTIGNRQFLPIPLLIVAALWYLLITSILMVGQMYLERYFGRGFNPATKSKNKRVPRRQAAIMETGIGNSNPFMEVTP